MQVGDEIKVYKKYTGTKVERIQIIEKIEKNQVWVNDYDLPFSLETGEYLRIPVKDFKIYIEVER